ELEPARYVGQRPHVDDRRAQLGKLPFGQVRIAKVQRVGDDETENRIAEELQSLVGRQAAVLVSERPMRQSTLQQSGGQACVKDTQEFGGVRLAGTWLVLGCDLHGVLLPRASLGRLPRGRTLTAVRRDRTARQYFAAPQDDGVIT